MTKITTDADALAVLDDPMHTIRQLAAARDYLAARLASTSPAPDGWQPIESAPEIDMTAESPPMCLVYSPEIGSARTGHACRFRGETIASASGYSGEWGITHWQPLPAAPQPVVEKDHG